MSVTQLSFDMQNYPSYRWENYYVADANQEAVNCVRQWPMWSGRVTCFVGPRYSGKTHLAHLWQEESRAEFLNLKSYSPEGIAQKVMSHPFCIVEDLKEEEMNQKLLALYNLIQEQQGYLLITAQTPLSEMHTRIPDLASRLNAVPVIKIGVPDDELLKAILIKRFSDQQLCVPAAVIEFLLKHMERSYEGIEDVAQRLDHLSLQHKRNLTIPFVREILARK